MNNETLNHQPPQPTGIHDDSKWIAFMRQVMNLPGIKIDRTSFIKEQFTKYCSTEQLNTAIEKSITEAGITIQIMDVVASNVVSHHKTLATGSSFLSGLPGGLAMLGTVPLDLAQLYYHTIKVAQKLAYIYDFPNLEGESEEDFISSITILIGAMSGIEEATNTIKQLYSRFNKKILKKESTTNHEPIALVPFLKSNPLVKQVGKWLAISISKKTFSRGAARIVPILGGIISGGITYFSFSSSANKLQSQLRAEVLEKK